MHVFRGVFRVYRWVLDIMSFFLSFSAPTWYQTYIIEAHCVFPALKSFRLECDDKAPLWRWSRQKSTTSPTKNVFNRSRIYSHLIRKWKRTERKRFKHAKRLPASKTIPGLRCPVQAKKNQTKSRTLYLDLIWFLGCLVWGPHEPGWLGVFLEFECAPRLVIVRHESCASNYRKTNPTSMTKGLHAAPQSPENTPHPATFPCFGSSRWLNLLAPHTFTHTLCWSCLPIDGAFQLFIWQ